MTDILTLARTWAKNGASRCTFCNRNMAQVVVMVEMSSFRHDGAICDKCVELAVKALESTGQRQSPTLLSEAGL